MPDKEEEVENNSSNCGSGSGGERKQPRPHHPAHLRLRGGGPLVAAAVAALGSAWGFAAAAFLVSAAASPPRPSDELSGNSSGSFRPSSSSSASSLLLSALPLPRGLPARGISLLAAAGCFAAAVTTTHGVGGRATAAGASSKPSVAAGAAARSPAAPPSSSPPPPPSPASLRRRFRFWQPFRGGGAFIATQAIGWSLTGLGTLGFLKVSAAVLASAAKTSAAAAAAASAAVSAAASAASSSSPSSPQPPSLLFDVFLTAALMPVAQAVLALSVSLWDASSPEGGDASPRQSLFKTPKSGGGGGERSPPPPSNGDGERGRFDLDKAAARSRSHPNSLPPLSTWPIIVLIYAPAHVTVSLIVAVVAASPLFGVGFLVLSLSLYYAVTEKGSPARTGRRHWPAVADALARAAEPALAAWHGGLEVVHDDLRGDAEWEDFCSRAEEDVCIIVSPSSSEPSSSPSSADAADAAAAASAARALVRAPLSRAESAILGVAPHGLFPASLLYLGRLEAFRAGGPCWPRGRAPPTPAVASAVMRVPVLRDLASFMGARAVTRSAIADALKAVEQDKNKEEEEEEEEEHQRSRNNNGRKRRSSSSSSGALSLEPSSSPPSPSPPSPSTPVSAPSVALVPGGQSELIHAWKLHSRRRQRELVLVRRHAGFVRAAAAHGAALVPVLVLGESASLADAISLPRLKAKSIKALGFPVPFLVSGRFFPGSPLPRGGTPLRFVVGPAVRVAVAAESSRGEGADNCEKASFDKREEAVAEAHERYFKAIERMFARHAAAAGHGDVRLVWADEGPERKMRRRREEEVEVDRDGKASFAADASVTVSVSVAPGGGKAKRE